MKKTEKTSKEHPLLCIDDLLYDPKLNDELKKEVELIYNIDFKFRNINS